ncbi:uncharacterized protein RJT20DRAFT_47576 [Scheffersomyces xylosifermentans]|uniref:uncharacterized protein n=1 Tax=Scheffersomyces xylosifermentans TaxID=1304137 RepID=UPI00315DA253
MSLYPDASKLREKYSSEIRNSAIPIPSLGPAKQNNKPNELMSSTSQVIPAKTKASVSPNRDDRKLTDSTNSGHNRLDHHIKLANTRNAITTSTSPSRLQRPNSRGLSPVRRSGSPIRRERISQFEHEFGKDKGSETVADAKRRKVTFDSVHLARSPVDLHKSGEESEITVQGVPRATLFDLKNEISEIRNDLHATLEKMDNVEKKLDRILELIPKQ